MVDGLANRVTVTRDASGIPHIVATTPEDLFFAQGFVQAQDRLFQMDLWRRSVQGRLSEVLGSNFIERDAMTRRMSFRGNLDAEWASYGPDTRAIATAFTSGINAWIALIREQPPEEFALAGWMPEPWLPEDLLNRTDAFLGSAGADDELFQARLSGIVGPSVAARLLNLDEPPPPTVDLAAINYFVADVLRRVGTAPFFLGLGARVPGALGPELPTAPKPLPLPVPPLSAVAFVVGPARTSTRAALLAGAITGALETPATRYLVHLQAPGWNVIGATAPWRPGVAIGHNERIAWSFAPVPVDTQDIFVERLNPANPRQVAVPGGGWTDMTILPESVQVKGRKEPYTYEKQYTPHGIVVAVDRERHLAYTLRWSGTEPGAAAELGALAVARAQSWLEFRTALARWRMPVAEFVYADVDGNTGHQTAGAVPVRPPGRGTLPAAGWTREAEWRGTLGRGRLPGGPGQDLPFVTSANPARLQRVTERLADTPVTPDGLHATLRDVHAWTADQLVPLLRGLEASDPVVEGARQRLLRWDRQVVPDSPDALLYVIWEHALLRRLGSLRIPSGLLDDFVVRAGRVLVPTLVSPSATWFDGDVSRARDAVLLDALAAAIDNERRWTSADAEAVWGDFQALTFRHPLAVSAEARRRYERGPLVVPGYHGTVFATARASAERSIGPLFEYVFDLSRWDGSRVLLAPGQSAAPDSLHFADQESRWREGGTVPLPFSESAVNDAVETRLTLVPRP